MHINRKGGKSHWSNCILQHFFTRPLFLIKQKGPATNIDDWFFSHVWQPEKFGMSVIKATSNPKYCLIQAWIQSKSLTWPNKVEPQFENKSRSWKYPWKSSSQPRFETLADSAQSMKFSENCHKLVFGGVIYDPYFGQSRICVLSSWNINKKNCIFFQCKIKKNLPAKESQILVLYWQGPVPI